MTKSRVGIKLKEKLLGSKSHNVNVNLIELQKKFTVYQNQLRELLKALQDQYVAMKNWSHSQIKVASSLSELVGTMESPISNLVGLTTTSLSNVSSDHPTQRLSFYSIHRQSYLQEQSFHEIFHDFIVDYVIQWDKVLTHRITSSLEQVEFLRRNVDHYEQKVQTLQEQPNSSPTRKKNPISAQDAKEMAERLQRNQTKLESVRREYETCTTDLCVLLEEVTDRGWRDLLPVFVKMLYFDRSLASSSWDSDETPSMQMVPQEKNTLGATSVYTTTIPKMIQELEQIATRYQISVLDSDLPTRLQNMKKEHSHLFSTQHLDVPMMEQPQVQSHDMMESIDTVRNSPSHTTSSGTSRNDSMEAKNGLEIYCYSLKNTLSSPEVKDKIPFLDKIRLENRIQHTLSWIESNPHAERDEYREKQKNLDRFLQFAGNWSTATVGTYYSLFSKTYEISVLRYTNLQSLPL